MFSYDNVSLGDQTNDNKGVVQKWPNHANVIFKRPLTVQVQEMKKFFKTFNKLYILFISAALLLFIAMIGAIVLTMDDEKPVTLDKNGKKNRFYSLNIN